MKIDLSNIIKCLLSFIIVCGIGFFHQPMAAEKTGANSTEAKKEAMVDPSYIIGPMDVLEIQVWKEPDFSRQLLVRPDGKITLPLVGDIQASGMNTLGLKALLAEKLKNFVDNPEITVILRESHSKNFYIIGNVNKPGTYPLSPDMTVLQAISVAGGLGEWADKDSIRIIRRSGKKEEIIPFNYDGVVSGKNLEQNIPLEPNDTVVVDTKQFSITGKVNQPGTYPLRRDMTVLQAISVAGGLGEWADKDSIRIIRRSGKKEEIIPFNYDGVISGKNLEQNIPLEPNDTIIVP